MSHRKKHGHMHHLSARHDDGFGIAAEELDPTLALEGAEMDDDDPDGVGSGWVETITGLTEDHGATDLLINGSHLNKATKACATRRLSDGSDGSCCVVLKLRMLLHALQPHGCAPATLPG